MRQFGSVFNKKIVKSVIYLLFSYQTGYTDGHLCITNKELRHHYPVYNGTLYVIQLSDRLYNVTFPAYALYSLRLRLREYRSRVYNTIITVGHRT
jgi:hypothetical protein